MRHINAVLEFEGADADFVKSYFRLDDNLPKIFSEISRDPLIKQAIQTFPGLRIARQNPWECLISYICATYKTIPAIKAIILNLSKRFGNKILYDSHEFFKFPEPVALAKAELNELRECKLGFRAERVRETARMVYRNEVDFEKLKKLDYEIAKNELLRFPGVGNKVADCILLFSLEKLEAFPVDVWMKNLVGRYYSNHFDASFIDKISKKTSLSSKDYDGISSFARDYFGKYAGYAQEYLFHFIRCIPTSCVIYS